MKKLNKKGFILIETLIVTVFVVTLFILIYQVAVPTMGEYEKYYVYDDIDSIYAANLYKQMLSKHGNISYIDSQLETNSYLDVSDCSDTNIYYENSYCELVKSSIDVTENDYIFITKYNIGDFKKTVKQREMFDSGYLSNFRDYINTVPNVEKLGDATDTGINYSGKYRIFITRTVTEADLTKSRRYVNIGFYSGAYQKFQMGEKVYYNPINNNENNKLEFYVLKNSSTSEEYVELILASNLNNSNTCFTSDISKYDKVDSNFTPDAALSKLKSLTDSWVKVDKLNNYKYVSDSGYRIDYSDYRARLIEEKDILEVLGCKNDGRTCFTPDEAFEVNDYANKLDFIITNLNNSGYWTAISVPNSNLYAWSIKKDESGNGDIVPTLLSDCLNNSTNNVGIRPIIRVKKTEVSR